MAALRRKRTRRGGSPAPGSPDYIDPTVWVTAFTVVVGAMAVIFDGTIVSVALHDLTTQLHASLSAIQATTPERGTGPAKNRRGPCRTGADMIVLNLVRSQAFADAGQDRRRAVAAMITNEHRHGMLRGGCVHLMQFLDGVGLLRPTAAKINRWTHLL